MNTRQAQAVLADFLCKCERERVALPDDAIDAVAAALRALAHEAKHEVGRPQIEAAMRRMQQQFGVKPARESDSQQRDAGQHESVGPKQAKKHGGTSSAKHSKIKDDVLSKPAKQAKNQSLVNQLVQLGEFELQSGHTQRGVARMRAAREIRDANDVITSGAQARQLDRVGPSAAAKINDILHGGIKEAMREYDAP